MADIDGSIAQYLITDPDVARPDTWLYKALLAVADRGTNGATDEELVEVLKPPGGGSNIRPRRGDLVTRGYLKDGGTKRPTATGRQATVWVLNDPVRNLLSTRFSAEDCSMAALVADASGTLSATDRRAVATLRARFGLLGRLALRAAKDSGTAMNVRLADSIVTLTVSPSSMDASRIRFESTLRGDGLHMAIRIAAADDGEVDADEVLRRHRLRVAFTDTPADRFHELDALAAAGWAYELADSSVSVSASSASEWLNGLAAEDAKEGVMRLHLTPSEIATTDAAAEATQKAVTAIGAWIGAVERSLRDPVQMLVTALLWSEERARSLVELADRSRQLLFAGPPGTGKTYAAQVLARALADRDRIRFVQFHPSYAYEDFVEGIRPVLDDKAPELRYEVRKGVFHVVASVARQAPADTRFFIIIDEMNRANLPRVLGELLFTLEYRGPENEVQLPYSGDPFFVPDNLWLIGTMNTADRSVALMDAAMRRRFKEVRFPVDIEALRLWHEKNTSADLGKEAASRLERLNTEIIALLDDDRAIGHSFLMRSDLPKVGFETVWSEDLEPVLRDHLLGSTDDLPGLRDAFLGPL